MSNNLPKHVAIVMDGNGRWAQARHLPRVAGHRAGVEAVRITVEAAAQAGIEVLSLFAFSKENWKRPIDEVSFLMRLMLSSLAKEVSKLHEKNIQLRIIGDRTELSKKLCDTIEQAEALTINNSGMTLIIAVNYSGQWDVTQACRQLAAESSENISQSQVQQALVTADLPDVDLFIRSSGEQRLSNFYLWQSAYSELYFTDCLWPDFSLETFTQALNFFAQRERRFGDVKNKEIVACA